MNIFVLCTGRCGSMTFAKACSHLTNYSAAHESRSRMIGESRFDYPDNHIEIDNRLSWFLGGLERRYGDDAFYVHLTRDIEAVAESYAKRWDFEFGVMRAFGRGLVPGNGREETDIRDMSRFMVEAVNDNISAFLSTKTQTMEIQIENISSQFDLFLERIAGEGDVAAAKTSLLKKFNVSR